MDNFYIILFVAILVILSFVYKSRHSHVHNLPNDPNKVNATLIYANWCSHCKSMKPYYSNLVIEQPDNKILYKMFEQNDGPLYYKHLSNIQGYPTLIIEYGNKTHYHAGPLKEKSLRKLVKSYIRKI